MEPTSVTQPEELDRRVKLPAPFRVESFSLLKHGIFDDSAIDVFANTEHDFAVLSPPPVVDYRDYKPRHQTLGLSNYKKSRGVIEARFAKIRSVFLGTDSMLEIGAADGAFLECLHMHHPDMRLAAIEPDESTEGARNGIAGLGQFASLDAAAAAGIMVDVICLFHVFEHLTDPASWLRIAKQLLAPGGRIVIEVPSLDDPLLSLFNSRAYRDFYFQKQHPFVYSSASLRRVLEHNGFAVETMPYQRYGLENHLTWLAEGRPGGSEGIRFR